MKTDTVHCQVKTKWHINVGNDGMMSGYSRGLCDWTLLEAHSVQDAKQGMHRQGCNVVNMSMTKPMCSGVVVVVVVLTLNG